MQIPLICSLCLLDEFDEETNAFEAPGDPVLYKHPVAESGIYLFECDHGHKTTLLVQEEHFQVLFEIALHAIVDGYFREAVATASAALERFYEFFFRVISRKSGIDKNQSKAAWAEVQGRSERELGLFVGAHLTHFKVSPATLTDARTSFRNKVVHKGKIPTEQEAVDYVEEVLSVVGSNLQRLKEAAFGEIWEHCQETWDKRREPLGEGQRVAISLGPTICLLSTPDQPATSPLREKLEVLRRRKFEGFVFVDPTDHDGRD